MSNIDPTPFVDPDPNSDHPIRKYRDVAPRRLYTDTSKELRYYCRSLWTKGQQLWDDDANIAFNWFSIWMPMYVHFRRDMNTQTPNYWAGPYPRFVMDKKHWPNQNPLNIDCVLFTSPVKSTVLRATQGQLVYSVVDKMYVSKWNADDGNGWRAAFRIPESRRNYEHAIFISNGKAGKIAYSYVVATAFTLYKDNTHCRFHTWDYRKPPLLLLKNGVQVGTIYKALYSSGVTLDADVAFAIGDILEVKMPDTDGGKSLGITLVGGLT